MEVFIVFWIALLVTSIVARKGSLIRIISIALIVGGSALFLAIAVYQLVIFRVVLWTLSTSLWAMILRQEIKEREDGNRGV